MKKLCAWVLLSVLLVSAIPASVFAQNGNSVFAGGDGSEESPYLVSTPEQLDAVRNDLSAHYLQTGDIDLSGWGEWEPIGSALAIEDADIDTPDPHPFTGSYNGGNYKITGLLINDDDGSIFDDCIGLFAGAEQATIKNVHIIDARIYADRKYDDYVMMYDNCGTVYMCVGGICGKSKSTRFESCTFEGGIFVSNGCPVYVGGITGMSSYDTVSDCVNKGEINVHANKPISYDNSSDAYCGGIIGKASHCDIQKCANANSISVMAGSFGYAGGICGYIHEGTVFDCANYAPVRCEVDPVANYDVNVCPYAGGIAGYVELGSTQYEYNHDRYITIHNCVNYGNIHSQTKGNSGTKKCFAYAGGIFGAGYSYVESANSSLSGLFNLAPYIYSTTVNESKAIEYINNGATVCAGGYGLYFEQYYCLNTTLVNGNPNGGSNGHGDYGKYSDGPMDGYKLTAEQLLQESCYGFDFKKTWTIDTEAGGAVLRQAEYTQITPPSPSTPSVTYVEALYRAEQLINGPDGIKQFSSLNVWLTTNGHSPSKALMDSMGEEMLAATTYWRDLTLALDTITEGPGKLAMKDVRERDLIAGVLMEALREQTKLKADEQFKNLGKTAIEIYTNMADGLKAEHLIGDEFRDFAKKHEGDIHKAVDEYFKGKSKLTSDFLKTADSVKLLAQVCKTAESMEDMINRYTAYMELLSLNEGTLEAVKAMRAKCPEENTETAYALDYIILVMESANADLCSELINGEMRVSAMLTATSAIVDKVWQMLYDKMSVLCPYAAVFASVYKLEKLVLEQGLAIDSRAEQYYKMGVVVNLESIANAAMHEALMEYQQDPSLGNAEVMLALVDLKFALLRCDYREAIRFSEITFDKALLDKMIVAVKSIASGAEVENTLKAQIEEQQRLANNLYYMVSTSWIKSLETDHPELVILYESYKSKMKAEYYTDLLSKSADNKKPEFEAKLTVACPVNVYVYDDDGNFIASVSNGILTDSDHVGVIYYKETKEIYFTESDNYKVICEGYDQGTMDIVLLSFDEGSEDRYISYYDVQVVPSQSHTLEFYPYGEATLTDSAHTAIPPHRDSSFVNLKKLNLTVENAYLHGGDSLFRHVAEFGEAIQVTAIVPEGYTFVGWSITEGDAVLEDEKAVSTVIYMRTSDAKVTAVLEKQSGESSSEMPIAAIVLTVIAVIVPGGAGITVAVVIIIIKKRSKAKARNSERKK